MKNLNAFLNQYAYKNPLLRLAAFLFDLTGTCLLFWLRWLPLPKAVKRILVVRLDHIGDVVLTLPAVDKLRDCFPEAQIDFLVSPWALELAENHPAVDHVHTFEESYFSPHFSKSKAGWEWWRWVCEFRKNPYDLAIDFRGDVRCALLLFLGGSKRRVGRGDTGGGFLYTDWVSGGPREHQLERNLRCVQVLGCSVENSAPALYYPPGQLGIFKRQHPDFFSKGPRPWIVLHIGSGTPSKRWPVSKFFDLAGRLLAWGQGSILWIGQQSEEHLAKPSLVKNERMFSFFNQTSLSDLCALIDACDLYIGNDSGPTHIAAGLGKKVITLFSGTNDYRSWQPRGPAVHLLRHEVPCSPCHEKVCPLARHDCMEDIPVEAVFEKAKELLHG